jgi:hypothetical protein
LSKRRCGFELTVGRERRSAKELKSLTSCEQRPHLDRRVQNRFGLSA